MKKFLFKLLLLIPILSANNNNIFAMKGDATTDNQINHKSINTNSINMTNVNKEGKIVLPAPPRYVSDCEEYFERLYKTLSGKDVRYEFFEVNSDGKLESHSTCGFFDKDYDSINTILSPCLSSADYRMSAFAMTEKDKVWLVHFLTYAISTEEYRTLVKSLLKDLPFSTSVENCEKGALINRMRLWYLSRNLISNMLPKKGEFMFSLLKFGTVSQYEELINKLGFNQPMVDQTTTAADFFRERLSGFNSDQYSKVFDFLVKNTEPLCKGYRNTPTNPVCLYVSSCCGTLVENDYTLDQTEIKAALDLLKFLEFRVLALQKVLELNISHCPIEQFYKTIFETFTATAFSSFTENKNPVDLTVDYLSFVDNMVELFGIETNSKLVKITINKAFDLWSSCNTCLENMFDIIYKNPDEYQNAVKNLLVNVSCDNYKKFIEILSRKVKDLWGLGVGTNIEHSPLYSLTLTCNFPLVNEELTDDKVKDILGKWSEADNVKKTVKADGKESNEESEDENIEYNPDEDALYDEYGYGADVNGDEQEG